MSDVLIHVSHGGAGPLIAPLGRALTGLGADWCCFFTHDGVRILGDGDLVAALAGASRLVVCEHSWDLHMAGRDCPVERGSQTINSAMMGEAARVVSL